MTVPAEVLQFLGSLAAILALAGFAWWLKLGAAPRLANGADALSAASEAVDGYEPAEIALDARGFGAVMRDSTGTILVLKPHGNKFAGRILGPAASATIEGNEVVISSGERRYGKVKLQLDEAQAWVDAINRIG